MEKINLAITALFTALLSPLQALAPVWGVVSISLMAGVVLAIIYGKISNQSALKSVKRSIAAGVFESVLFRHDLPASLRAQLSMLWGGTRYFALAIPPILILLIPSLLILAQLNLRYGSRVLRAGESAIITLAATSDQALFDATLTTPPGVSSTPPLRDLDSLKVSWRIDTSKTNDSTPSPTALTLAVAGATAVTPLYMGLQPPTLPTELHSSPLWQFFYPGGSVPESLREYVRSISVTYPEQQMQLGSLEVHWIVLFGCLSILAGIAASRALGIEI